jgi:phage baseplate assembly protein W
MSQRETAFLGRGWAFPPTFSADGAAVEMSAGFADIRESLQILLRTAPGERVMQELFGCDLSSQQFEEIDQELMSRIERLIEDAILEFEPRVTVESVEVKEREPGCLLIAIAYSVIGTNSRFNMVFPFYVMEAAQPGP